MSQLFSLAKEFVKRSLSGDERDPLTGVRLHTLLYYAQAWSLVIRECQMFEEDLVAGQHGPMAPELQQALSGDPATDTIAFGLFVDVPDLDAEDAAFARSVWESYSALGLPSTPPSPNGSGVIGIDEIEEHFGKQALPAPLEVYREHLLRREAEAVRRIAATPPIDANHLRAAACFCRIEARRIHHCGGRKLLIAAQRTKLLAL